MGARCHRVSFLRRAAIAAVVSASVAAALPAGAEAATCVNKKGTQGCFASIQAAIAAVPSGGRIVVRPGTYYQSFTVDKPVVIEGGGKTRRLVVIDGDTTGTTVTVTAPDVTLRNLTVRNSHQELVHVTGTGGGFHAIRVDLDGANVGDCFRSDAWESTLLDVNISRCGSRGVEVAGNGFTMQNTTVRQTAAECVLLGTIGGRVIGSALRSCGGPGLSMLGDNPLVRRTRVRHAASGGIVLSGNNATVRDSVVQNAGATALTVVSLHPLVSGNRVSDSDGQGIEVSCGPGCFGGEISGNSVAATLQEGIRIVAAQGEMLVEDNVVSWSFQEGIQAASAATYTLRNNTVRNLHGDCFFVTSSSPAVIAGNTAMDCRVDGIAVYGAGSAVRNNLVGGSFYRGISIAPGANGVTVTGNTARTNFTDFCDASGTAIVGPTNRFRKVGCP